MSDVERMVGQFVEHERLRDEAGQKLLESRRQLGPRMIKDVLPVLIETVDALARADMHVVLEWGGTFTSASLLFAPGEDFHIGSKLGFHLLETGLMMNPLDEETDDASQQVDGEPSGAATYRDERVQLVKIEELSVDRVRNHVNKWIAIELESIINQRIKEGK